MNIVIQRLSIGMSKLPIYYWMKNLRQLLGALAWPSLWTTRMCQLLFVGQLGTLLPSIFPQKKFLKKIHVYSYGIMLLELITGKRAIDHTRLENNDDLLLLDWVKGLWKERRVEMVVDPDLQKNYIEAEVESLIQVALLCTQDRTLTFSDRPKMSQVVRMLQGDGLAERWEEWQKVEVRHEGQMVPH